MSEDPEDRIAPTAKPLSDPKEHPEQHAALQTGLQGEGEPPQEDDPDGVLAHEEHSDSEGPFGTG